MNQSEIFHARMNRMASNLDSWIISIVGGVVVVPIVFVGSFAIVDVTTGNQTLASVASLLAVGYLFYWIGQGNRRAHQHDHADSGEPPRIYDEHGGSYGGGYYQAPDVWLGSLPEDTQRWPPRPDQH